MPKHRPLFLIAGKEVTVRDIADLHERLTGRKATEDEMAEVEKLLAQRKSS